MDTDTIVQNEKQASVATQHGANGKASNKSMAGKNLVREKQGLGTSAVFLTAISTILGAIMFLRFGWAAGTLGFSITIGLIIIGHIVTIPTAMAIAEIATNQKVEGGGEYFIISRSFGLTIGGTIGFALYLSQAISVAFYIIAFSQAFEPFFRYLLVEWGLIPIAGDLTVTLPTTILLLLLILKKGADLGVKALYIVVGILFLSLLLFFLGKTEYNSTFTEFPAAEASKPWDKFGMVFAICFPGFTGMTAGVGLSGDLKNPSKSIPIGTLAATLAGMVIYIAIVYKLCTNASPADLVSDQLVMSKIALWGPIIPIGLAAATLSSALGSILVAPRTLQAIGKDNILPFNNFNRWVAKTKKGTKDPFNSTLLTATIVIAVVLINDVDIVARIISMFFMVTYGALCSISFLEHFAADPSYRPSFKSKWYFSLVGAVLSFFLMFYMDPGAALMAIILMVVLFFVISFFQPEGSKGIAAIFQGVIFQLSRRLQVFLQKVDKDTSKENWRPSIVCLSESSFDRKNAFELLTWISHKYGFGTYIHHIKGYFSKDTKQASETNLERLIKNSESKKSNIYLDTLITPSLTASISQVLQLPGISGKENNTILMEFTKSKPETVDGIIDNFSLMKSAGFDVCILASSIRSFGFRKNIHIWITSNDYQNANLMILLGYIILGHKEWRKGAIKIFTIFPKEELKQEKEHLMSLINSGRLPISPNNIELIPKETDKEDKEIINSRSQDADLIIIGFRDEVLKKKGNEIFSGFDSIGDILFVNTSKKKEIT